MDEVEKTKDSAIELMRVLKPIIAYIPNKKERKRVSDNLAKVLKNQVKDAKAKKKNSSVYSKIVSGRASDSAYKNTNEDIGAKIAEMYNPHYKKEVK